jgi:hypothetical protein
VNAEELRRRGAPPMALSYARRFGEVSIDWWALGVQPEDGDDFRFVGGQRLIVEPFAGLRLEATGISVRAGAEGAQTWIGRLEGPTSGEVTITRHRDAVFGAIHHGLDRYVFQSGAGGRVFVRQADHRALGCRAFETCAGDKPRAQQQHAAGGESDSAPALGLGGLRLQSKVKPATPSIDAAKSGGQSTVDILVLYTPEVTTAAGGHPQTMAMIQQFVDETNASFIAGGIQGSLNLVGTSLINGVNQAMGPQSSWIDRVQDLRLAVGPFAGVPAFRDNLGADLVALLVVAGSEWVGGQWVAPQACGMATVSSRAQGIDNPALGSEWGAFSVVDATCHPIDLTFTHEIGHNLGALEDQPEHFTWLANTGTPDFNLQAATRHSVAYARDQPLHPFRTLMAVGSLNGNACSMQGCPRILRWSSPNQVYHVGGWLPYALGGPTGLCVGLGVLWAPCVAPNVPQMTDNVASHQYAIPLIAQYRGAPLPPLSPGVPNWARAGCTSSRYTVVISWSPSPPGPPFSHYELELSTVPGFPFWATTLIYSGPLASHLRQITAQSYIRVRACGPGGCSAWQDNIVPFPFPAWLPPPSC